MAPLGVRLDGRLLQRTAVGKQPGKDIMHDVHALLIVVQEDAGQPEHGPVMLLEQPFDLSFPVCHTLLSVESINSGLIVF